MVAWLRRTTDFFRFVSNRRHDGRYGILPSWPVCAISGMAIFLIVYSVHVFADPVFFEWYQTKFETFDRTGLFFIATDLGKSDWMLWGSGCIILAMSLRNLAGEKKDFIIRWNHFFLKFYFIFTAVALSGILAIVLKTIFGRARPVDTLPGFDAWYAEPFIRAFGNNGFPSGHSTSIAAICMAVYLLVPRMGIILLPIAFLVGVSRAVVGAHFPSDVAAGLILGAGFTWLHARNFARKRLLFEFSDDGRLMLRNSAVNLARRIAQRRKEVEGRSGLGGILERAF